eukprot:scaffold50214_cov65-Phaeocystis_antarctica.AAC.7
MARLSSAKWGLAYGQSRLVEPGLRSRCHVRFPSTKNSSLSGDQSIRTRTLEILHDVNLSASRPRDVSDVVAEGPEGGPRAEITWYLEPRLPAPVLNLDLALRCKAPRGDTAVAVLARGGVEHPVTELDVFGRVDVALQLVVIRVAGSLDIPRAAVERLEPRAVKVVTKEVLPCRLHGRCERAWRGLRWRPRGRGRWR